MPWTAADQHAFNVRYYAENREEEIARVRVRAAATLEFLRELRRVPCADCGGAFQPYQMDFDHRDPSTKAFQVTDRLTVSRARLLAEIDKCDVICANCHAIRTYAHAIERRMTRVARLHLLETPVQRKVRLFDVSRRSLLARLRTGRCADCGVTYPHYVMEFDHRDPSTKMIRRSQWWRLSRQRVLDEAAKCDLRCRNCHRARTFQQRTARGGGMAQAGVSFPALQPRLIDESRAPYAHLIQASGHVVVRMRHGMTGPWRAGHLH
jgi:hypothetical protein